MNPISVFKVGKPINDEDEDIIFDKMVAILDESDIESMMEDEDEDGVDLIFIPVDEEKRKKLVNLFEEYNILQHHESFTLKQKP